MISENPSLGAPRPRGRPRTRVEVEDVPRLHLPTMLARGQAVPGKAVSTELAPSSVGGPARRIVAELKERHGQVLVFPREGRCYAVEVTSDLQPFGGRRWWFVCPVLRLAVSALYLPPGAARYASRQAHGLGYRSQRIGRREGRAGSTAGAT